MRGGGHAAPTGGCLVACRCRFTSVHAGGFTAKEGRLLPGLALAFLRRQAVRLVVTGAGPWSA
jgi:hypothetical protein